MQEVLNRVTFPITTFKLSCSRIYCRSCIHSAVEVKAGKRTSHDGDLKNDSLRRAQRERSKAFDLTNEARTGRIDAVIGRDQEIRRIVDVLMRRRQNNPILTGEAGVGKTAVVEGLALRIAAGDVPPALRDVRLHSLDLALLQAGASVKGEFENRLKGLVQENISAALHEGILMSKLFVYIKLCGLSESIHNGRGNISLALCYSFYENRAHSFTV